MRNHRRGQQVQPKSNVAAPRFAGGIADVPAHGKSENHQACTKDDGQDDVFRIVDCTNANHRQDQRHHGHGQRGGSCRNGNRHHKSLPMQPCCCSGYNAGQGDQYGTQCLARLRCINHCYGQAQQAKEHTANKAQQQDDAGQSHAFLQREKLGQSPRNTRDQKSAGG